MSMLDEYTELFYCSDCQEVVVGEHKECETACELCGTTVAEFGHYADAFAETQIR
jgi:tRNA G26 N,N-dimethylase Trm1